LSNYVQSTNFATKDALSSGDPLKIVKGTEINTEFNNIATAVATKADLVSPTFTGTPVLPTGTTAVTQTATDDTTKLATTAFVQDVAAAVKEALFPVGSIYTNATNATNPGTLLGFGTWAAFGAGRVPVGFNAADPLFDTAEETGGSKDAIVVSHTHTISERSLTGNFQVRRSASNANWLGGTSGIFSAEREAGANALRAGDNSSETADSDIFTIDATHNHTASTTGSSGTNANLQPYITVYMFKRTA
jgi:hypothetical protein